MAPTPRVARAPRAPQSAEVVVPTYQPLEQPLTMSAQHALQGLHAAHSLRKLKAHMLAANGAVTETAGEINDCLIRRQDAQRRRHARLRKQGAPPASQNDRKDEFDVRCEELQGQIEDMTTQMEASTRRLVDLEMHTGAFEDAVKEIARNPVAVGGPLPWSTLTGQQHGRVAAAGGRRGRNMVVDSDGDDDDDETGAGNSEGDVEPDEQQQHQQVAGLARVFKRDVQARKDGYEARPKRQKYAKNNNYVGFKRIVHDALNPGDDAPPVPHPDTWFPATPRHTTSSKEPGTMDVDDEDEDAEGRAANDNANQNNSPDTGTTARRGQRRQRPAPTVTKDNDDDEDEDDEVAIAREKTSLKCPITLLPFRMPVTSRKCPHSFEKEAIFGMINHSGARLGGAGGRRRGDPGFAGAGDWGVQAVKCPVCEQMLTKDDFQPDHLLMRRIKRLAEAERNQHLEEGEYDIDIDVDLDDGEGVGEGGNSSGRGGIVKGEKGERSHEEEEEGARRPSRSRMKSEGRRIVDDNNEDGDNGSDGEEQEGEEERDEEKAEDSEEEDELYN